MVHSPPIGRKQKSTSDPSRSAGMARLEASLSDQIRDTSRVIGFALLAIVMTSSVKLSADETSDLAPLREYIEAYENAWNTHDAAAIAAFFSKDADMILGNASAVSGRNAIEASWRTYFDENEQVWSISVQLISARRLTPNVVIANVKTTTGSGKLSEQHARGTWLLRQEGGKWHIAAMRGLPAESDHVELKASKQAADVLHPDIRAFVAEYEETFNRQDADALAQYFRSDADIIIRNGAIVESAKSIGGLWRRYFSQPRPYRALMIVEDIKMIESDVALVNVIGTGAVNNATDRPGSDRYTRATWLLVRQEGRWLIAALRVLPSEYDLITRRTFDQS